MKEFTQQQIELTSEGKPIMGFVINKKDFPELEKQIYKITGGKHILATKEEGDKIKVSLFGYNLDPPKEKEIINEIKNAIENITKDKAQITSYSDAGDPLIIDFDDL